MDKKEITEITIKHNSSFTKALEVLEKTKNQILICSKNKKYYGVINDGDIRRAILKGVKLNEKITKYINTKAITVNQQTSLLEASKLLSKRVISIPVVDQFRNIVDCFKLEDKFLNFENLSKDITIIGMGYVGLTLAAVLSAEGFRVFGFDNNKKLIQDLKNKKTPFYEKGLKKYINNKNLIFSTNIKDCISKTYIITVGTPLKKNLSPSLDHLGSAIAKISKILKKNDLIILRSTIPLGSTKKFVIPLIKKISGLNPGDDFLISFAPERTAEGRALQELRSNPQIIGGWNEKSTNQTATIFNNITHSIVKVPNIESAEICKLIDNSFRDHQFAFINQFIPITEKMGLNLSELVDCVNHGYTRNNIPKPSPGVGGPCLTKDPYILIDSFKKLKIKNTSFLNARHINTKLIDYIYNKTKYFLKTIKKNPMNAKILLVGMAFKGDPATSDLRESTSVWLLKKFKKNKNILICDLVVPKKNLMKIHDKVVSINSGFKKVDVVFFLNNHSSYLDLPIFDLIKKMNKPCLFFDMWNQFNSFELKKIPGLQYWGLGNGE